MDVGRKALILARLLGYPGRALADVRSSRWCPSGRATLPLADFLARLDRVRRGWRAAGATRRAERTRCCATWRRSRRRRSRSDCGRCPRRARSPRIKGTDNQLVFTTARYKANPLVITGPGAGAEVTAAGVLNDILRAGGRVTSAPARVTAFAPGGVGNVGPGLDVLGLAVAGAGDAVAPNGATSRGITSSDPGHPRLPRDPTRHTVGARRARGARRGGRRLARGARASRSSVQKDLPLSGGQGGSAASAVAGAVAANALLGAPLDRARRCSTPASSPRRRSPAATSTTSRRRCSAASSSSARMRPDRHRPASRARRAGGRARAPRAADCAPTRLAPCSRRRCRGDGAASGGSGRRDGRGARARRLRAAGPRDR